MKIKGQKRREIIIFRHIGFGILPKSDKLTFFMEFGTLI
jgi:hypothetical protein